LGKSFSDLFSGNGWSLDNSSILKQITLSGLREEIALATDVLKKAELEKKLMYLNGSRLLLISVFAGISALVFVAQKKRDKGVNN
jgi:NSS family neurotransmitter:Na+ symporter